MVKIFKPFTLLTWAGVCKMAVGQVINQHHFFIWPNLMRTYLQILQPDSVNVGTYTTRGGGKMQFDFSSIGSSPSAFRSTPRASFMLSLLQRQCAKVTLQFRSTARRTASTVVTLPQFGSTITPGFEQDVPRYHGRSMSEYDCYHDAYLPGEL